jgi:outer membrane lipoprotein SlyB
VATSRDRVKGAAIGALGGAVLGGVIGHQVKTPR